MVDIKSFKISAVEKKSLHQIFESLGDYQLTIFGEDGKDIEVHKRFQLLDEEVAAKQSDKYQITYYYNLAMILYIIGPNPGLPQETLRLAKALPLPTFLKERFSSNPLLQTV